MRECVCVCERENVRKAEKSEWIEFSFVLFSLVPWYPTSIYVLIFFLFQRHSRVFEDVVCFPVWNCEGKFATLYIGSSGFVNIFSRTRLSNYGVQRIDYESI